MQKQSTNVYDLSWVTKTVILKDQGGVKKFKPNEMRGFTIDIPDKGAQKFFSRKEDRKQFFQEIIAGNISRYHPYSRHPYDGSLAIIPVARKNNKLIYLNVVNRKQIAGRQTGSFEKVGISEIQSMDKLMEYSRNRKIYSGI